MQKQLLDFTGVRKLIIKSIDSDVQVSVSKTGEFYVTGPEKDLLVDKRNEILEISTRGRFIIPMLNYDSTPISVLVPANLGEIFVNTVSGDLKLDALRANKISIKTTSGDIVFAAGVSDFCEIRSISGDTSLSQPNIKRLVITSISGDIVIKEILCGDQDWIISSVSGDVELDTAGIPSMRLTFRTAGGDFTSNVGYTREGKEYVIGDGRMKLVVSTTSGDLTIRATNRAERTEDIERKILKLVADGKLSYEQAREILRELM